jgi:hypothetical protein
MFNLNQNKDILMLLKDRDIDLSIKHYQVAFVFILGIAAFLRFHELGQPYFWQDEIFSVWPARNFLEGLGFTEPVGTKPYLRAWITSSLPIAASFSVLGYTEFAARLPSVIIGLSTIIVAYFLGKDIGGKKLALLASGILAVDFWVINWHTQARMYVHNQFLYILGIWLFYRWYDRDELAVKSKYLVVLIPNLLLGIHNHISYLGIGPSIGAFLILSLLIEFKGGNWKEKISENHFLRKNLFWVFLGSISAIVYLVTNGVAFPLIDYAPPWYTSDRGIFYYIRWLANQKNLLYFFGIGLILMLRDKINWIIPLAFGIPFIVQSSLVFKHPRLIFHLYPLFIIISCIPLVYFINISSSLMESKKFLRNHVDIISIALIFLLIFSLYSPLENLKIKDEKPHGMMVGTNHRAPAHYISERKTRDEIILSSAPSMTGWYLGDIDEVDYDLNYLTNKNASENFMDPKIGIRGVESGEEMERIISKNSGWVVADNNFYNDLKIKTEVRSVILDDSRKIENQSWQNVDLYRFE